MKHVPIHPVLGVGIAAIDLATAVRVLDRWIETGERHYVCLAGAHGLIEARDDPALRRIYNRAGMATPDGMPLVWLCRVAGFRHVTRVYGPDLLFAAAEDPVLRAKRHFFFGGDDGVAEILAENLKARFPGFVVAGCHCPPFRPLSLEEDDALVAMLNASDADIIWVGLGSPKQDRWMAEHRGRLNAAALIGIGAAFDFHSGRKRQAPLWMQKSGTEWLFRVVTEPKRLVGRYARVVPRFALLVLMEYLGLRRFPIEDA